MNKKQKIIIITIILSLVLLFSGLTYAYFTSAVNSESGSTIIAKGGTMNVIYDNGSGDIVVENIYPREKEWVTKKFTVTGNNTTDLNMYYRVSMVIDNNEYNPNDLSYTLTSENTSNNGEIIPSVTEHTPIMYPEALVTFFNNENQVIGQGMFTKGQNQVHTYTLKIFFDETGEEQFQESSFTAHLIIDSINENGDVVITGDQNLFVDTSITKNKAVTKTFKVTSNLNAEQEYKVNLKVINAGTEGETNLKYTLTSINEGNDGTTMSEIKSTEIEPKNFDPENPSLITLGTGTLASKNSIHSYTLTFTGNEDSVNYLFAKVEIEVKPKYWKNVPANSILAGMSNNYEEMESTKDDYGEVYYYTGEVEDNYVSFANMCWRIVRTTGNKDIKLVLYNDDSSDCTLTGDTLAFAKYDGTTYTTEYNSLNSYNTYVGFMYGKSGSSTYAEEHANTNKSIVLKNLEAWYKLKLNSYTDKLADVIWCNDKSTEDSGISSIESSYNGFLRVNNNTPSLICPDDNDGGKLSKFTVEDTKYGNGNLDYKIGLLTGDELVYAGYVSNNKYKDEKYDSTTIKSFLRTNTENISWWTMTPSVYAGKYVSRMVSAYPYGNIMFSDEVDIGHALRPSIALKSTTTINGGDGTASNPYVIED